MKYVFKKKNVCTCHVRGGNSNGPEIVVFINDNASFRLGHHLEVSCAHSCKVNRVRHIVDCDNDAARLNQRKLCRINCNGDHICCITTGSSISR